MPAPFLVSIVPPLPGSATMKEWLCHYWGSQDPGGRGQEAPETPLTFVLDVKLPLLPEAAEWRNAGTWAH